MHGKCKIGASGGGGGRGGNAIEREFSESFLLVPDEKGNFVIASDVTRFV